MHVNAHGPVSDRKTRGNQSEAKLASESLDAHADLNSKTSSVVTPEFIHGSSRDDHANPTGSAERSNVRAWRRLDGIFDAPVSDAVAELFATSRSSVIPPAQASSTWSAPASPGPIPCHTSHPRIHPASSRHAPSPRPQYSAAPRRPAAAAAVPLLDGGWRPPMLGTSPTAWSAAAPSAVETGDARPWGGQGSGWRWGAADGVDGGAGDGAGRLGRGRRILTPSRGGGGEARDTLAQRREGGRNSVGDRQTRTGDARAGRFAHEG